jgi:hypothetical protein
MAEQATYQRVEAPSIMLIALDPTVESLCLSTLLDSGLRILRVREVAPAFERIAVTMPKLVIVPSTLPPRSKEELTDRCVAVGAQLLALDASEQPDTLKKRLAVAAMGVLGAIYG